jgi:hypothetical protein
MSEQQKDARKPGEVIEDIATDPDTRGLDITCVGPNLRGVDWSMTDGDRETSVALCAEMLKGHIHSLGADDEKFIRDVVSHYNGLEIEKSNQNENRDLLDDSEVRNDE